MVNRKTKVFVGLSYSLIDVSTTFILLCHGNKFQYFAKEFYHFTYKNSNFDLFCASLLRCCCAIGLSVAVLRNPVDSIYRISKIKSVIIALCVISCMYVIVKLLVKSEVHDSLHDKWFWFIFAWTIIGSTILALYTIVLSRIKIGHAHSCHSVNIADADVEEREPLLEKSEDKGEKSSKVSLMKLLSHSKPDIPYLMMGFIFLSLSSSGQIFIPFFTGEVVDSIVIEKSQKKFTDSILLMTVISIISSITAGCRGWCFSVAMARLGIRIRNFLFGAVIDQEIGFFDTVKTGDITSRLTSDTTVMTESLTLNMNIFTRNLIMGIGIIVFMFKLSWRLSLLTLISLPIVLGVSKMYGEYYRELAKKVQDSLAAANDVAEEAVSSVRTVRSFANEGGEKERYRESLDKAYKLNIKQSNVYAGFVWCTQLFELGLTVVVLYYGGHLVLAKTLSGGNLVSFILYEMQLGNCIEEMGNVFTDLMQAAGASEKVFEYIGREPLVKNVVNDNKEDNSSAEPSVEQSQMAGMIQFNDVTFAYPSRPETTVLKNVTFTVKPGEVIALVGPSGGGKSSCINLMEHFYEPVSGEILLDSIPVKDYDHKLLHSKISLVGQEPVLYARSIKDNIAYGMNSNITMETVQHAASLANAHQFIMEMKDQYETEAGEKGQQLSGGQKQRIAIARALIRKPVVLLLDEATSALDSESEHVVQQAIYNNLKGRTVIIIAHRLSTVERADRIIVIDKGRVLEEGTHLELLRRNGKYASLVQRQLLQSDGNDWIKKVTLLDSDKHNVTVCDRDRTLPFKSSSLIMSSSWH